MIQWTIPPTEFGEPQGNKILVGESVGETQNRVGITKQWSQHTALVNLELLSSTPKYKTAYSAWH